jgi:hypothetical protein
MNFNNKKISIKINIHNKTNSIEIINTSYYDFFEANIPNFIKNSAINIKNNENNENNDINLLKQTFSFLDENLRITIKTNTINTIIFDNFLSCELYDMFSKFITLANNIEFKNIS